MKKITLILLSAALLLCAGLSGCTDSGSQKPSLTPEERTQLYETAITSARDQELNEAIPVLTDASDDTAQLIFPMLGLTAEDMEALALKRLSNDQMKYAMIIFTTLPIIFAYPFLQKYFVKGVMVGSLKG